MGVIKGVLREELENSIRLIEEYKKILKKQPGGSLLLKDVKGHKYYYLVFRAGKKVRFVYKGKKLSKEFMDEFKKSKQLRNKYKEFVQQLNKRIKYLKKVLHGKEDV